MYRGFKIEPIEFKELSDFYLAHGQQLFDEDKIIVRNALSEFATKNNSLDGSKIQEAWFPQIKADVFISHSHKDEEIAIQLAGWLFVEFGIRTFIDSCLWGYSNDLLQMIDNSYCKNLHEPTYNYQKRNYSTSHVHMMLSTALGIMIDRTECLFFLDSPNAISSVEDSIKNTESPWIYFENTISRLVNGKIPDRFKNRVNEREERYFSAEGTNEIQKSLAIEYKFEDNHLTVLNAEQLEGWRKVVIRANTVGAEDSLDKLYEIASPISHERKFIIKA